MPSQTSGRSILASSLLLRSLEEAGILLWARGPDPSSKQESLKISVSSQQTGPSSVFIMFSGTKIDRHDFALEAIAAGCRCIVGDDAMKLESTIAQLSLALRNDISVICVTSGRGAWAILESTSARNTSIDVAKKQLLLAGVTGTNGKTSTVWLLRGLLEGMGIKTGSAGTLGLFMGDDHIASSHTSPDPDVLYPWLQECRSRGTKVCALEVSSHSLAQEKLLPLKFMVGVFTSFSRDHLDFHQTEENYFAAKMRLFTERLASDSRVILHSSLAMRVLAAMNPGRDHRHDVWVYGLDLNHDDWPNHSSVSARIVSTTPGGTFVRFSFLETTKKSRHSIEVTLPLFGRVFVENAAAAVIAAGKLAGIWPSASHFEGIKPVPGRMELVYASSLNHSAQMTPAVFVDYAHTPDALEKALQILRQLRGSKPRKIWCVFGCGGDRDSGKRPLMAKIAATLADRIIITSDNPRSEDPDAILDDIQLGLSETSENSDLSGKILRLSDRADAVAAAIREADDFDLILVAGKGHENYQEVSGVKHWFDDRVEVRSALTDRIGPSQILVIGAGVSGIAAAKLAATRGLKVFITDQRSLTTEIRSELAATGINYLDSEHSLSQLSSVDLVVLSPGVRPDHIIVVEAKKRGIPVRSEIDFALRDFRGRLVVVTGTNGKSTIASMIGHLLSRIGIPVSVGGNIGDPPSAMVTRGELGSTLVLETSSYQLEQGITPRADVAVFSSFSHDHMDRHGTPRAYFKAKWKCFDGIKNGGLCLFTTEVLANAKKFSLHIPKRALVCEIPGISCNSPDKINREIAIKAVMHLEQGTTREQLIAAMADFQGLPYRRQLVGRVGGNPVINDSKSTNCESTCAALGALEADKRVVLMMGGKGKGESYRDILAFKDRIEFLICFGESGQNIADELCSDLSVQVLPRMNLAATAAAELSRLGKCGILFSPGCASFDEFRNFEHRGQEFNHAINQWLDIKKP
jgi:UDP-N-acetylmuramoylalanine--D-glutamate ligase